LTTKCVAGDILRTTRKLTHHYINLRIALVTVKKKSNQLRTNAAPDDLFILDNDAEKLSEEGSTAFHHLVATTLYISKRARPDVSTAIAFLTTRVRALYAAEGLYLDKNLMGRCVHCSGRMTEGHRGQRSI
jgi:hypothetical protein